MFKQKVFSIFIVLLITIAQFAFFVHTTSAAGFELSPAKWDGIMKPGEVLNGTFSIKNKGETVEGLVSVLNFTFQDETGSPKILPPNPDLPYNEDFSKWFTFSETIDLPQNDTVEIPYTITVPEDASPGGHFATIFVEQKKDEEDPNAIHTVTRIGSLFILKVDTDGVKEEMSIENIEFSFSEDEEEKLFVDVSLKNSGNVHLVPQGKVSLLTSDGKTVNAGDREAITDGQGIIQGTKEVDYLRFNKQKFIVLPGQTRKFTEELDAKDLNAGDYIADFSLGFDNGRQKLSRHIVDFEKNTDNVITITNTEIIPVKNTSKETPPNLVWAYVVGGLMVVVVGGVILKRKK